MEKKQTIEEQKIEEDLIDITTKIHYKGECYLFIQYGDMKMVLKQVMEDGKVNFQVPPAGVREELLKLIEPVVIHKAKEKENRKVEESSKKETKQKSRVIVPLLLATEILISLHKVNPYDYYDYYDGNKYYYVGIDYDELLDRLPENDASIQEVLSSIHFLDNKYYGSFSDLDKEAFRNRAERFFCCLTEEEQEVFKYQLSHITIQKGRHSSYVGVTGTNPVLYVEDKICEGDCSLEYAFCKLMQNCYIDDKKNYYVFNNQQFLKKTRVELGDCFPFYNNTLFLYYNYPEYQKELSRKLEDEGALYYQLMLQVLDSNMNYLPFNYQMEDVIKAYQKISPSRKKVIDLFGRIGVIQSFEIIPSFENDGRFYDYEVRDGVIALSSEYFIEREKQVAIKYSQLTAIEENREEVGEQLISEFVDRYVQFLSQLKQIDQLYPIQICEIWDFESPYKREVLPYVYHLEKEYGMIPESMTEEEFQKSFFDKVNEKLYGESPENEVKPKEKEKNYIFHYPLSTR